MLYHKNGARTSLDRASVSVDVSHHGDEIWIQRRVYLLNPPCPTIVADIHLSIADAAEVYAALGEALAVQLPKVARTVEPVVTNPLAPWPKSPEVAP